jgi:hypothetical protein
LYPGEQSQAPIISLIVDIKQVNCLRGGEEGWGRLRPSKLYAISYLGTVLA